jgi:hypothetical protein
MLSIQDVSYAYLNKDLLFNNIGVTLNNQCKVALIASYAIA